MKLCVKTRTPRISRLRTRVRSADKLMTRMRAAEPISFAGGRLGAYRHACAFFNSREEDYEIVLLYFQDGYERGEKAVHNVYTKRPRP